MTANKETQSMIAQLVEQQIKSIYAEIESVGKEVVDDVHGKVIKTLIKGMAVYQVESVMNQLTLLHLEAEFKQFKADVKQLRKLPSLQSDLLMDTARRSAMKRGEELVPRRNAIPVPNSTKADVIPIDRKEGEKDELD